MEENKGDNKEVVEQKVEATVEPKKEKTTKTGGSKKKVIIISIIVVAVIVLLVAGFLGYQMVNDKQQEMIFAEEISTMQKTGKIDSTIKTTGKYGELEKGIKDVLQGAQTQTTQFQEKYNSKEVTTMLKPDTLKTTAPNFETQRALIAELRKEGESLKQTVAQITDTKYIGEKADELGIKGKYKDLFVASFETKEEEKAIPIEGIDALSKYLDNIEEILDLLQQNQGKWEVVGSTIQFNDNSLLTKYNSMVIKLRTTSLSNSIGK